MKITKLYSIASSDFPGVPWIGKLLEPLNDMLKSFARALDRGITVTDNTTAVLIDLRLLVPAGGVVAPFSFAWPHKLPPQGLVIASLAPVDFDQSLLLYPPVFRWQFQNGRVEVTYFCIFLASSNVSLDVRLHAYA